MRSLRNSITVLLLLAPAAFPGTINYIATLSGAGESTSSGTGFADVLLDTTANTFKVDVSFSGLTSGTTASHIHCCTPTPLTGTAIVATQLPTFLGFPLGVTSGTYENTFDLTLASTYNPAFVTANGGTPATAEAALLAALAGHEAYLNIHTANFPAGEIDGFLVATPEPGTIPMMLSAAMLLGLGLKRRSFATRD
jgi:hypothetical protein